MYVCLYACIYKYTRETKIKRYIILGILIDEEKLNLSCTFQGLVNCTTTLANNFYLFTKVIIYVYYHSTTLLLGTTSKNTYILGPT